MNVLCACSGNYLHTNAWSSLGHVQALAHPMITHAPSSLMLGVSMCYEVSDTCCLAFFLQALYCLAAALYLFVFFLFLSRYCATGIRRSGV